MNLAICHPAVVPDHGNTPAYVAAVARRLARDGHAVHLYASVWDAEALGPHVVVHRVPDVSRPGLLSPWRFSRACLQLTAAGGHALTIGFGGVSGVDVLYPQGGLYRIAAEHRAAGGGDRPLRHALAAWARLISPAHLSSCWFERVQYGREPRPFLIASSDLVRRQFLTYLGVPASEVAVLHAAAETDRLIATDRPARRVACRQEWGVSPTDTAALFLADNYRLGGLSQLLRAVGRMADRGRFRLLIVGGSEVRPYLGLAERLGVLDCVRFLGQQAGPGDAFFAADLLVQPTLYNPCSLAVLEAQACGLPVITTQSDGAAELLSPPDDSLVIAGAEDTDALTAALEQFQSAPRRQAASRLALKAAQRWNFDEHYRRLVRLLEEAERRKRAA